MNNDKKFYRKKFQALRMKLLKNEMDSLSDKIFSLVKKLPIRKKDIFHLFISSKENISEEMFTFVVSLAEQCFFNEYIYVQEEKDAGIR